MNSPPGQYPNRLEICEITEKYSEVFTLGDFIFAEYKLKLETKVVRISNMVT